MHEQFGWSASTRRRSRPRQPKISAGVGTDDAEQDLQQARTIYGIDLFNRYLKTYLEVGAKPKSKTAAAPGADSQLPLGPRDCKRDVLMLVATVLLTVG